MKKPDIHTYGACLRAGLTVTLAVDLRRLKRCKRRTGEDSCVNVEWSHQPELCDLPAYRAWMADILRQLAMTANQRLLYLFPEPERLICQTFHPDGTVEHVRE